MENAHVSIPGLHIRGLASNLLLTKPNCFSGSGSPERMIDWATHRKGGCANSNLIRSRSTSPTKELFVFEITGHVILRRFSPARVTFNKSEKNHG